MTQDELKQLVGQAAADYVNAHVPEGAVIGVGTGSTNQVSAATGVLIGVAAAAGYSLRACNATRVGVATPSVIS